MKDRLSLISQATEITNPPSECPVDAIETAIKLGLGQNGWSFDEDAQLRPNQAYYLAKNNRPIAMFHGHLRELPGGIEERAFFIGQNEWEELPPALKEILINPKYRVEVCFV